MYKFNIVLEVLQCYKDSVPCAEIIKRTGVSKSTIYLWIFCYIDDYNKLMNRYNKQHKDIKKILDMHQEQLYNQLQEISYTMKNLQKQLDNITPKSKK